MGIQTAPSTLSGNFAGKLTSFTLIDLADNVAVYRATEVGDVVFSGPTLRNAPLLTITRRPANPKNPNVKYTIRFTTVEYNVLGQVTGRATQQYEHVVSGNFAEMSNINSSLLNMVEVALSSVELGQAIQDGAFFR